jgi:hypothetical protein
MAHVAESAAALNRKMSAVLNIAGMAKATMMLTRARVSAISSKEYPAPLPCLLLWRRGCGVGLHELVACIVCLCSFLTYLVPRLDIPSVMRPENRLGFTLGSAHRGPDDEARKQQKTGWLSALPDGLWSGHFYFGVER